MAGFGIARERALTSLERLALLPEALAARVDLSAVRIVGRAHNPYADWRRITVVRGARIFWPGAPAEATTLSERAHLAHELVHVWQYQALRRTGIELLASRRYRYDLAEPRLFGAYGYEQQAAIVEDFVRLSNGAAPRWTTNAAPLSIYERVIASAVHAR
jgi:hypothetical protein